MRSSSRSRSAPLRAPGKVYCITPEGQRRLAEAKDEWNRFRLVIDSIFGFGEGFGAVTDFPRFLARIGSVIPDYTYRTEIEEEVLDHLESAAAHWEEQGMKPAEARRRAIEEFGDPEGIGRMLARGSATAAASWPDGRSSTPAG